MSSAAAPPSLGYPTTGGYYASAAPNLIPSVIAGMPAAAPSGGMAPGIYGQDIRTQEISIPEDLVGCIIGKGGQRIAEIRRQSGARILIDKAPDHNTNGSSESLGGDASATDDGSHNQAGRNRNEGERLFTITGTSDAIERALYLLYAQLDAERTRRLQANSTSYNNIPAPGLAAPSDVAQAAPAPSVITAHA